MNKKRIMIITILIMMIITFVGGTLAYLTWTTGDEDKTNIVFTYNADFQCAVNGGGNITSADVVLVPSSCNNENHAIKRELVVTPTLYNDSMIVDMNLWMNIDSIDSGLSDSQNFRYALTTSSTSCTKNVISSGTFNNRMAGDQITILNKTYTSSLEETYYLYIWLDKAETDVSTSGQSFSISLGGICEGEEELDIPNAPVLASGMIPVKIANDGTATTVSPGDDSWYNYKNKNWANAVLVNSTARSSYYESDGVTIKSNQVIPEDNILAYYVWIPSYSYKINGVEEAISISFSKTPQGYRYHPAFLWDNNNDGTISSDEKISGLWIGKFGVGHTTLSSATSNTLKCSTTTCTNADGLRIKPYLISSPSSGNGSVMKTYDNLTTQFYATRSMERSGNPFGLVSSQVDAHMLKNIDWGAITYLAHSVYGINGEMSGNYIGGSGCASIGTNPNTYTCYDQYGTVTSGVYTQSTSGNITGIFDMLGYSTYIMAYVGDPATYFNGISSIYYDSFLRSSFNTACNGGPCYGHALDEVDGWYNRTAYDFTSVDMRFFTRGDFRYAGGGNLFNPISITTSTGNGLNGIGFKSVIVVFED